MDKFKHTNITAVNLYLGYLMCYSNKKIDDFGNEIDDLSCLRRLLTYFILVTTNVLSQIQ